MKKILFLSLLILLQISVQSQSIIPANINIHKNVMTIANYNNENTCGLVRPTRDVSYNYDKELVAVMKKTGAYDLGSGFVYEYGGEKYVITCEHVIFKSEKIMVTRITNLTNSN